MDRADDFADVPPRYRDDHECPDCGALMSNDHDGDRCRACTKRRAEYELEDDDDTL